MNVNNRIKILMNDSGITQYGLAKKTGIPQPYISRILKNDKSPPVETLEKICFALGITLAEFFSEDSQVDPAESELLSSFRQLDDEKKQQAIRVVRSL